MARDGIPIVGRLTLWELLGFLGVLLAIAAGLAGIALVAPVFKEIAAPGSGGGAQMILAMLVLPAVYLGASLVLSGAIGFVLLLRSVRERLDGRAASPLTDLTQDEVRSLQGLMHAMTASLVVQALCLFGPSDSLAMQSAVVSVALLAGCAFLVFLAMLAVRLKKNWALWVFLAFLAQPFGPLVAYFMMRKAVKDAVAASTGSL